MKISATIISFALALQLEGLPTKKPRLTKYTMKPSIAVSSVSTKDNKKNLFNKNTKNLRPNFLQPPQSIV